MKTPKPNKLDARGFSHIVVPLVVAVIVASVGTYFLVASHADAPDTVSQSSDGGVTVTNANNKQTVNLQPGQTLHVDLSNTFWPPGTVPSGLSESSTSWWSGFASSNPAIVTSPYTGTISKISGVYQKVAGTSAKDVEGSALRSFVANGPGTATITATSESNNVCGAGIACPLFAIANNFTVTVVVQ